MAWQRKERKKMEDVLNLISEVGVPIAGALVMGVFIFLIMKQLFSGLIDDINQIKMFPSHDRQLYFRPLQNFLLLTFYLDQV